eukprot:6423398-Pyramimonas_sp.AAC.1
MSMRFGAPRPQPKPEEQGAHCTVWANGLGALQKRVPERGRELQTGVLFGSAARRAGDPLGAE